MEATVRIAFRLLILLGPLAAVLAGIYILLQPVVVTEYTALSYSNTPGVMLILLGFVFLLVAALLVSEP